MKALSVKKKALADKKILADEAVVWVVLYNTKEKKFLISKRSRSVNNAGEWNFFGGHIDRGELPLKTAVRELYEESRIKVTQRHLKFAGRYKSITTHYYYYVPINRIINPPRTSESDTHKWVSKSEIKSIRNQHISLEIFNRNKIAELIEKSKVKF